MKISYNNYPILEKLHKCSLGLIPMFESDKLFFDHYGQMFIKNWKFYNQSYCKEINVISKPFQEAALKAQQKLIDLWSDIIRNDTSDLDVKGTYIIGDFVYMLDYEIKRGSEDNEIAMYMFDKKGIPLAMLIDSTKYKIYQNAWVSNSFEIKSDPKIVQQFIYSQFIKVLLFRMFKTFAEVETKFIPANSRIKEIGCKYINDTKLNLNYLDSKWFTNLVKSDGFNVRGHFRLQPKKLNGVWIKELIWINEFEKHGYTSQARKLL